MKYENSERLGKSASDAETKELAKAYCKTLETLFRIATGTSSAEGEARLCLKRLGLFGGTHTPGDHWNSPPSHSVSMGHLMGYDADECAEILRTEHQEPRACPHVDGSFKIPGR